MHDVCELLRNCEIASLADVPTEFVLYCEQRLKVLWAPFDYINSDTQLTIVGVTPGWRQTHIVYSASRKALNDGKQLEQAFRTAKSQASFAGSMRNNLVSMLDEIGISDMLNIASTADVLGVPNEYIHTTSALRYPVFKEGRNYTGHGPNPLKNPFLTSMVEELLAEELERIAPTIVVPLGKSAGLCVRHALEFLPSDVTVLENFPHPSGANGHRVRQFAREKGELAAKVRNFKFAR